MADAELDALEAMGQPPCDLCGEPATAVFVDHQRIRAVQVGDRLYRRHRPLEHHALCKRHLRPPRLFGPDGKLIEAR